MIFKISPSPHLVSRTGSTSNLLCDLFAKLFSYVGFSFTICEMTGLFYV